LLRDATLMDVCLAVYTNPLLQRLCAEHRANDGSLSLVLQAVSQPDWRELFVRPLKLPSPMRDAVEDVLELDDDDMRALRAALQNRDVFKVLYYAAHNRDTRAAMQIAIRGSRTPALGLAVMQGKGAKRLHSDVLADHPGRDLKTASRQFIMQFCVNAILKRLCSIFRRLLRRFRRR
jgi:hypothetical protein